MHKITCYQKNLGNIVFYLFRVGENSDSTLADKLHHTSAASHDPTGMVPTSNEHIQNGQTHADSMQSSLNPTRQSHYGSTDNIHNEFQSTEIAFVDMSGSNGSGNILGMN